MHVYIHFIGIHGNVEHTQRKFVLHQILFISFLHGPGHHITPDKPAVDKINLKIAVGTHQKRLSQIAFYMDPALFGLNRHQRRRHITTVNTIYYLFQISVSGGVKFHLIPGQQLKRNIRSGKRQMLH